MKTKMTELALENAKIRTELEKIREETTLKKIRPYQDKFASKAYHKAIDKAYDKSEKMLKKFYELDLSMKGPEHFSRENVFVWGGPTPSWGGSMEKDAGIKAKKYFDLDNVMYVYGPLNDEMLKIHKGCKKVICHLGRNCRTEGAAMASDADEAEKLSKMSLKYKNIVGGVVDDMSGNYGKNYSHKEYLAIHDALHKHNPDLELYGVVYAAELENMTSAVKAVADCIDHVILWFWWKNDLMEFDLALERCRALFPGKPIMLGIFMFDYGACCLPNSAETMAYHFEKARRSLAAGKIQDIVILGDREIEKCPEAAKFIKQYLKNEFAKSAKTVKTVKSKGSVPHIR